MPTTTNPTRELFTNGMTRFEEQLNHRLLEDLDDEIGTWLSQNERIDRRKDRHLSTKARMRRRQEMREVDMRRSRDGVRETVLFLRQQIASHLSSLYRLAEYQETLKRNLATAKDEAARKETLLDHAEILGASMSEISRDRKAFQRWFDEDAVFDRYKRRRGETQQRLTFRLERFAGILGRIATQHGLQGIAGVWRRLSVNDLLLDILDFPGDARIHVAAVKCYRVCLEKLPIGSSEEFVTERSQTRLYEFATNEKCDIWLQCESLSSLMRVDPARFASILQLRLENQSKDDDIFVRRRLIRELTASWLELPTPARMLDTRSGAENFDLSNHLVELREAFKSRTEDESVFVRQQLAKSCWSLPADAAIPLIRHFLTRETHPQVIVAALAAAVGQTERSDLQGEWLRRLPILLNQATDEFVLRAALFVASRWLATVGNERSTEDVRVAYRNSILPAIQRLRNNASSTRVRRWAAQTYEQIVCCLDPAARSLLMSLSAITRGMQPGHSRRIPSSIVDGSSGEQLGRVLAVLAQNDFGYDLRFSITGCWITRQPQFGSRLWRILHEIRNPATDKRQAFPHTVGRVSYATIRVPSQILGELSRTKVPGEPFYISAEGSWRPYLPLVDDFLSVLNLSTLRPKSVRFFTSQGVTWIMAPTSLWQRFRAWCILTWKFDEFANRRDWEEGDNTPPSTYLDAFRDLGFQVKMTAYGDEQQPPVNDDSVTRFFGCLALLPAATMWGSLQSLVERFSTYFYSVYDNTLQQLVVFVALFALFFIARHFYANWTLSKARERVPLFLGGWGTRGKSGTERLKAALISALGYGMVSKTTGCEAMFIHGSAFGDPLEIPLYRPYDKATIWEHANVIHMADRMDSAVFLWECMGLNPTYVDILQRQWSRDDLATVTNTYPDHEDIQGPAGYNVACTIAGFVPCDAHVITTEQEMLPIVQHSCKQARSTLHGVGWLESGLIPDEVLDRFPYREHPDNIALVAAMADELGVEYDYALKAMADELIPDLGVLKAYPVSEIRSRFIEFTNGMSANERFGCLGNWTRLKYDQHDPHEDHRTWISTVINNRADRVARSRVFSSIVVNDLSADRHFLIGTNLKGLVGFIQEDLDARIRELSFAENGSYHANFAERKLVELAKRHRQPTSEEHVRARLSVMLAAYEIPAENAQSHWNNPEAIGALLEEHQVDLEEAAAVLQEHRLLVTARNEYTQLHEAIVSSSNDDAQWQRLDEQFRGLARTWFERSLVVIDDSTASGEQIVDQIVKATPPGVRNRVMGMQNIKGTGLDFVYRFQDWNTCYEACAAMDHPDPTVAKKGLETLQRLPVLGQLCASRVREALLSARELPKFQTESQRLALSDVERKLETCLEEITATCNQATDGKSKGSGPIESAIGWFEEVLDANDAIRRRSRADQIYVDLAEERISRQRAIVELRKINKRQKGGWLSASLRGKSSS